MGVIVGCLLGVVVLVGGVGVDCCWLDVGGVCDVVVLCVGVLLGVGIILVVIVDWFFLCGLCVMGCC